MSSWRPYIPRATGYTGHLTTDNLIGPTSGSENETEERYRAARAVASRATDAEDCAQLLDMLGLTADDGLT